jgi:intein/homing endonuclease
VNRIIAALVLTLALGTPPARAHEKGDRQRGVVESVAPERIVVKTSDGHEVAFKVTPETRFLRGEERVGVEDVRVGQRAVVQGKRAGETLEAVQVKLGAAPSPK